MPDVHGANTAYSEMTDALDDAATDPRQTIAELQRKLAGRTAELAESLERQNATAEILRMIASAPGDAGRSLQLIAETSARLFGAPSVSIQLVKDGEWADAYRLGNSAKSIRVAVPLNQIRVGGRNLPGTVVGQNRQIHIPDLDHLDPSLADFPGLPVARAAGTRTMCGTPLRREGEPIGALIVYRDRLLPFTNEELALQQTFADQAVIAIENARLFDEVQAKTRDLSESLQQQTATAEVLNVISNSPGELGSVFTTVLENATRICDARFATLLRFDGNAFYFATDIGTPAALAEYVRRPGPFQGLSGGMIDRILKTRRMQHTPDYAADPAPGLAAKLGGARSALGVPILKDDVLVGAIVIYRQEVRPFSNREIELVQSFAAQAAIAIENARLFNETREALERQTATAEVLKIIAASPTDVQPVFEAIVQTAVRLLGCETSFIQRCDSSSFWSVARCRKEGLLPLLNARPGPIDPAANFPSRAMLAKQTLYLPDWSEIELPEFERRIQQELGYNCAIYLPLLHKEVCLGVLGLAGSQPRMFNEADIALAEAFRDQVVIAIRNTQLFEEVQQRTRELSQSLEDLRTAQDRLVQTEKLASLGQLTAGIAHEIKNPLNFVNNFSALSVELLDEMTDVFENSALDEAGRRKELDEIRELLKSNLEKVVQHGKRADSIVKNMLLHSREGSSEQRSADINALLDESLNLAYHGARAEKPGFNITLQRELDPSAGEIELFPQEITRAFLNLISNGFYAASKRQSENGDPDFEPILSAATKNLGNHVEIRIRDNGTGIPAEVMEKIFNPFFTTKPAGEGTGLGLSMSHDIIVKQHGGRIEVDTRPGQFTEFTIVLPRTTSPANNRKS
jgi:two-component system NtrC family sensor kinase